ncbi:putative copper resistance protein CopD [Nocardia nova SH22a]|uniref:Putative copper resistance protein CopD n=1 Tax=Nocardia nova SH22a TaxID=1415166 RepID=W5T6G9_9NOCA|nr:CopD family protein [Nocardia nova]AHH14890.1 putative copper resistance protein CopD [Nocardia nova SH22a]
MTSGTTGGGSATLRYALLLVVPAVLIGVVLGWALAAPDAVQAEAPVRALADGLGATVLGLAALPRLHDRLRPAWRMLAVFGGLWAVTEFVLLATEAAEVVGVSVFGLRAHDFGDYLAHVSGGQIGIAVLIGTVAVTGYSALAHRRPEHTTSDLVLVFAAVTLVLRPITGHMSQQTLGSVLAAVHALAAAAWFGVLLALALVVRSRGEWAVILPRYSGWALPAVAAVTVTGVCNGLVRIGGPGALVDTGYGRIMVAKTVVVLALLGLGWWWRRTWVPRASDHRMDAGSSLRRALIEVAVMGVAFGLAAALSVTA